MLEARGATSLPGVCHSTAINDVSPFFREIEYRIVRNVPLVERQISTLVGLDLFRYLYHSFYYYNNFLARGRSVKADDCISHMSIHDTDPKYKCQAEGCKFACAALQTFNNHFRNVHLVVDGPVYCCHLCDKKYKRGTLLGKHLRAVHKLERPPGHSRFRYDFYVSFTRLRVCVSTLSLSFFVILNIRTLCFSYMEGIDGNYRLQIERYESIEANDMEMDSTKAIEESPNFILKCESPDVN